MCSSSYSRCLILELSTLLDWSVAKLLVFFFFFSSRRRHTRLVSDWSSDVCSSDLVARGHVVGQDQPRGGGVEGGEVAAVIAGVGRDDDGSAPPAVSHGERITGEIGRASCRERV